MVAKSDTSKSETKGGPGGTGSKPADKAPASPTKQAAKPAAKPSDDGKAKGGNGKGGARVGPQGNQNDGTEFVHRIEEEQAEIDEIMRKAREACAPHREDIKAIKDEAVEAGHKKSVINEAVRQRKFERKAAACGERLDEVDTTAFEQLTMALDQAEMRSGASA